MDSWITVFDQTFVCVRACVCIEHVFYMMCQDWTRIGGEGSRSEITMASLSDYKLPPASTALSLWCLSPSLTL